MTLVKNPQQSTSTVNAYKGRALNLAKQCRRELGMNNSESLDYRRFVGWLISNRRRLSKSSWRQYKAAVVFFLQKTTKAYSDSVAEEALEELLQVGSEECSKRGRQTSSNKLKKFTAQDHKRIQDYLDEKPIRWGQDLGRWIEVGILTGLRPHEWKDAELTNNGKEDILVVLNAKATNGRANGEKRTLILDGLGKSELQLIKDHLERCRVWKNAGQFGYYQQAVAGAMGRIARILWPKRRQRVTLYSTRHQFAANAKACGFLQEEIAAMMGHGVDITAKKHYGRKVAGFEMVRVRPDLAEVANVRRAKWNQIHDPKNQPLPQAKVGLTPPKPVPPKSGSGKEQ